jgi:hypothetical protein
LVTDPEKNVLGEHRVDLTLEAARYDTVSLSLCNNQKGVTSAPTIPAIVAAQYTIDGTTFFSKSDGTVSATGPAEPATISMCGCNSKAKILWLLVVSDKGATEDRSEAE